MGCVTNSAYISAASLQAGAIAAHAAIDILVQKAMARWQRKANRAITEMQREIAERQMVLAEAIQTHAEQFWPVESQLVNDAFTAPLATPDYALGGINESLASGPFAQAQVHLLEDVPYHAQPSIEDLDMLHVRKQQFEDLAISDSVSHGLRTAEARETVLNDRRYERQYKVLGIGRGLLSEVTGFQGAALRAGNAAGAMKGTAIGASLEILSYGYARGSEKFWGYADKILSNWESREPASRREPAPDRGG